MDQLLRQLFYFSILLAIVTNVEAKGDDLVFHADDGKTYFRNEAFKFLGCYKTTSGHICCNKQLEKIIHSTVRANSTEYAAVLQRAAQDTFQTSFEAVIGSGRDFASKTRFKNDYVCKTAVGDKVVFIYGTSSSTVYSLTEPNTPLALFSL